MKKQKVILMSSIAITLVFLIAMTYICYTAYANYKGNSSVELSELEENKTVQEPNKPKQEVKEEKRKNTSFLSTFKDFGSSKEDTKLNILVLGVDARQDDLTGRSDAMLVLSLDKTNDKMDILSIPRDSYVEIAGKGKYDKITHAFAYGGVDMARETVENLLDIEFDHYVVINFTSFTEIIDALGGVEIDVPFSFSEQNSKGVHDALRFTKGLQTLNGEEALAYARMRKQDPKGDIGRGERQQQVIEATLKKLTSISSVTKYTEVYKTVSKSINTDVGITDIPSLSSYVKAFSITENHTLKGSGMKLNGVYYYKLDDASLNEVKDVYNTK